jgi:ribonuclease III
MDDEVLRQIETKIDYQFLNKDLLQVAFTHSSSVPDRQMSNERLEFLGDAILGLVICQELYEQFPDHLEGDMTKSKSMLVSRRTCSQIAKQLGLIGFLKVGKGMMSGRALSGSLSAGLMESLVAAIYIDGGLEAAKQFILTNFAPVIEEVKNEQCHGNYKSLLQQYAQKQFNTIPVYDVLDEQGPDHNKCFEAQAVIGGRRFQSAWGTNKKESEQRAAYNALIELDLLKKGSEE